MGGFDLKKMVFLIWMVWGRSIMGEIKIATKFMRLKIVLDGAGINQPELMSKSISRVGMRQLLHRKFK